MTLSTNTRICSGALAVLAACTSGSTPADGGAPDSGVRGPLNSFGDWDSTVGPEASAPPGSGWKSVRVEAYCRIAALFDDGDGSYAVQYVTAVDDKGGSRCCRFARLEWSGSNEGPFTKLCRQSLTARFGATGQTVEVSPDGGHWTAYRLDSLQQANCRGQFSVPECSTAPTAPAPSSSRDTPKADAGRTP
jgi:hypothetical protein